MGGDTGALYAFPHGVLSLRPKQLLRDSQWRPVVERSGYLAEVQVSHFHPVYLHLVCAYEGRFIQFGLDFAWKRAPRGMRDVPSLRVPVAATRARIPPKGPSSTSISRLEPA